MKNRWIDTQHGSTGEKIYELYDPEQEGELIKESFQEWLCDNRNQITQCIGIALRNQEKSYAECDLQQELGVDDTCRSHAT